MRLFCFLLTAGCLLLGSSGCALRATTDFGPQSETTKRSVNGGLEGQSGVPLLESDGTTR